MRLVLPVQGRLTAFEVSIKTYLVSKTLRDLMYRYITWILLLLRESTSEPPTTFEPYLPGTKSDLRVVCYFTNWAWYREGKGQYKPENVDPYLCTHIHYAFGILDDTALTLKIGDSWTDIDNKFYEKIVGLKTSNPELKVLLSLGGGTDSSAGDNKYSRLVASKQSRANFIKKAVILLKKYGFDGLDLDWEFPACTVDSCEGGNDEDKENFVVFLKELRSTFDKENLLLSAAVSAAKDTIDSAYDIPNVSKYLDYINVMTYDLHGAWEDQAGLNAPLYYRKGDWIPEHNVNYSINYWLANGAEPQKLVVGVPLYGRAYTLADPSKHDIGAPITGPAEPGEYTKEGGILAYSEICSKVKDEGWNKVVDPKTGVYAYKDNQWVGYDDAPAVARKAQFVLDNQLGGVMVWAMDLDDFYPVCCDVSYPLLKTLSHHVIGYPDPGDLGCE